MWFKVDDKFWCHPKVIGLSSDALALWLKAGCWSAQQLTDGFIPANAIASLGSVEAAHELVSAGLWEEIGDDGFGFHDWEKFQPTREQAESHRAQVAQKRSEAGRKGAKARWGDGKNSKTMANGNGKCHDTEWQTDGPVPSRPVPTRDSYGYVDPSSPVSTRGREDRTDQFQSTFDSHRIDPDRVRSMWAERFGEDITDREIVVLFQQLQTKAKAPILDGTAYIVSVLKQQPGECQNLLMRGAA